jgi:hypothetical protein
MMQPMERVSGNGSETSANAAVIHAAISNGM